MQIIGELRNASSKHNLHFTNISNHMRQTKATIYVDNIMELLQPTKCYKQTHSKSFLTPTPNNNIFCTNNPTRWLLSR